MESSLQSAAAERHALHSDLDALSAELQELKASQRALRESNDLLREELSGRDRLVETFRLDVERLTAAKAAADSQSDEARRELVEATHLLRGKEAELMKKSEIADASSTEMDSLRQNLRDREVELTSLKERVHSLAQSLQEEKTEAGALRLRLTLYESSKQPLPQSRGLATKEPVQGGELSHLRLRIPFDQRYQPEINTNQQRDVEELENEGCLGHSMRLFTNALRNAHCKVDSSCRRLFRKTSDLLLSPRQC
jgi:prefoldin subunit 5